MILGSAQEYLYVELPQTGSTAVANELVDFYGGSRILQKHSTYQDFVRSSHNDGRKYFVFSAIRNPLDQVVSQYFKIKLDHRSNFSHPKHREGRGGIHSLFLRNLRHRQFERVCFDDLDFEGFLLEFYRRPYSNWSLLAHKSFNAILRFENLSQDFTDTLRQIGIESQRDLPTRNKTAGRESWQNYFKSESVREHAKYIFSPFMKYWSYEFPADWGEARVTKPQQAYYEVLNLMRLTYWKNFRYRV